MPVKPLPAKSVKAPESICTKYPVLITKSLVGLIVIMAVELPDIRGSLAAKAKKSELSAAMATLQVCDGEGNPRKGTLKSVVGLEPLANVVVCGKVAEAEAGKMLVVNVTGVHIQPPAETPPEIEG